MYTIRRTLAIVALVALTSTAASAQIAGMTSSGGNSMRPADPVAPVARIERPSLREIVERLIARAQWRPVTTVASTRTAAKRKTR